LIFTEVQDIEDRWESAAAGSWLILAYQNRMNKPL